MKNMRGFRPTRENIERWVSKEAQGFLGASFFGALVGGFAGAVLCFGLGAFFAWIV